MGIELNGFTPELPYHPVTLQHLKRQALTVWDENILYAAGVSVISGDRVYTSLSEHTSGFASHPGVGVSWETYWAIFPNREYTTYPYVVGYEGALSAPATDLTGSFNGMVVVFPNVIHELPAWEHLFTANKITDVWAGSDGAINYEEADPSLYTALPRYPNRAHLFRVTTGSIKIVGVYFRGDTRRIKVSNALRPINSDEIFLNYIVGDPSLVVSGAWTGEDLSSSPPPVLEAGDYALGADGNLYYTVKGGQTAGVPDAPVFDFEYTSGLNEEVNGDAVLLWVGNIFYAGAWKAAYTTGINWYFANLGIGWLVKSRSKFAYIFGDHLVSHLKCAIDLAVRPWQAETTYYYGMQVVDVAGYVWRCWSDDEESGASDTFPVDPEVGDFFDETVTLRWENVGITNPLADWQLMDSTSLMTEVKSPDSHDAYAATLVWAAEQMRLAGLIPDAFYTDTSKHGITYVAALKEILYDNIFNQMANNLSKTFQGDIVPNGTGDIYDIQFLMDNCEVYAGIKAAYDFYSDDRYTEVPEYPAYIAAFLTTVLAGINSLWDDANEIFAYYLGYDNADIPSDPPFYPWLMAQAWISLFEIPVDYYKKRSCLNYTTTSFPDWWQRNSVDDLAALGAHVGYFKHVQIDDLRLQILARVEQETLKTENPFLYLHDFGYYLYLRNYGSLERIDETIL